MTSQNGTQYSQTSLNIKRVYNSPLLIRYGSIPQLTQGSGSNGADIKGENKGNSGNFMPDIFDGASE